ncbi:MAG TPA: MFS transporter [Candidatus Binatia bacterium]|nr:MFS transporter [Candidatus Binatia bacterium]
MKALPTSLRAAYAAPAFALAAVGIPVYVHLPKFYTDVVGVPVGTLGMLLMAARLLDGVLDPLIGALSDRTRSRQGRRRPFIAAASIPLAASLYFLFTPPLPANAIAPWWFAGWLFAVFFLWAAVMVPYEALGAELTFDYDQRTSLLALRDGALLFGTLVAAASPTVASALLGMPPGPEAEAARFRLVALVYGPLIVAACLWCAWSVGERVRPRSPDRSLRAGWNDMLANRPFLILLASYAVAAVGSNLPATLVLFYVEYVLQSGSADYFMLLYLISGIVCLPMWVAVSRRYDKKRAWLCATAVNTGAFLAVWFLGPGDAPLYAVLVVVSGIGFGASIAIPSSMQADVIDYDELLSGSRREGSYLGIWAVARKLAAAVGVGAGLHVLDLAGYVPNAEQTPHVQSVLVALYALVPCACNAAGFAIALAYPIGRREHAAIRIAAERRALGHDVVDPLRGIVLAGAG